MGELHRLPLRDLPVAPDGCSPARAWELLRAGVRITHATMGELVEMLDGRAAPEAVFRQIDLLNTQLAGCGCAVTFLREAGEPPEAA
jgi:hypothetical protein